MEWTIEGEQREALIDMPAKPADDPPPLVFGFHAHGGNMQNAARSFRMHELWPEAVVVVYMQGVNTPVRGGQGRRGGLQLNER